MSLPIALVFHFNQHTSEHANVANRVCYRGLLNVLRAHPQLKFNLHLSGTLLRALNWFDSETLDLVRAGLAEGQFEMLGSTYAQNIPYVSHDWDNTQQINAHRHVLKELFEVEPTAFWLAERCWRQSLVPVIAQGGYRVTLVEDHILRAAGHTEPLPINTQVDGHTLTLVYDDPLFRERFNYAAWFGRRAQLFNYLEEFTHKPNAEKCLLAYAEDAEALGLWPYEAGYLPHATWAHLDKMLTELEERPDVTLVHLSSAKSRRTLDNMPDGAARWMDISLARPDAPYHEDGYANWFDFVDRSSKVEYFRKLYSVVRSNLQQVAAARIQPSAAGDEFFRQALEIYASHQYEFGCIGVGGRGYWGWENVRTAFLYGRLAELADNPQPRRWIEDLNGDGSDEQVLFDGRQLALFTAYGARLLGWFDLASGVQWVGNPLAVPPAPFNSGGSEHPRLTLVPNRWLPETFEADLKPWKDYKQKEARPTRMGRFLSPELLAREPEELPVYVLPPAPGGLRSPLSAQLGALNDWLKVDGGDEQPADRFLDYRFEDEGVISYLNALTPDLVIDKRVRLVPSGLQVQYTLHNHSARPRQVRWRMTHEVCPDYAAALNAGQACLQVMHGEEESPVILNTHTGARLQIKPSRAWSAETHRTVLLGLELTLTFEFDLPAGDAESFTLELSAGQAEV